MKLIWNQGLGKEGEEGWIGWTFMNFPREDENEILKVLQNKKTRTQGHDDKI